MEWLDVQSGVVGAFRDMSYRDGALAFGPGDVLVLYTDGTTEARMPTGAFFGEEGLRDAVVQEWEAGYDGLLDRLLARVDAFTENHLADDVAMVAVRMDQ
jgi:serine phosphatase RsbU (regulator of sigma subunit)